VTAGRPLRAHASVAVVSCGVTRGL
jgi:hypothetical protein